MSWAHCSKIKHEHYKANNRLKKEEVAVYDRYYKMTSQERTAVEKIVIALNKSFKKVTLPKGVSNV